MSNDNQNALTTYSVPLLCTLALIASGWGVDRLQAKEASYITVQQLDGRLRIEIGGQLFTEYIYHGYAKPILYPVIGPHNIRMTRNYPMKPDVAGEAHDHMHHKSMWFTHGDVNGVDFWGEGPGTGHIAHDKILRIEQKDGRGVIQTSNTWLDAHDAEICRDTTTLAFFALPSERAIDWITTIHAADVDVTFGDTKEGTQGIRMHPNLRLSNDSGQGVTTASGRAVNSEGVRGQDVWGKRAKWIDYSAVIDNKMVGIAIMDHPTNPRHPTWWHARQYGLVAANPFGVHDFEGKPEGTGKLTVPAGESITFRYRFIFHEGDAQQAKIALEYEQFVRTDPVADLGLHSPKTGDRRGVEPVSQGDGN